MLDIDFFRSEFSLARPIVYRYRTGRFRPTFRRLLSEHPDAITQGFIDFAPDDDDAREGGLFFDSFRYCDWSEPRLGKPVIPISKRLFQDLAVGKPTFTANLFWISRKLDQEVDWAAIGSQCLVIEEAAVTAGLRARYVDYLLSVSPLIGGNTQDWRPALDAHLDELTATEGVDLNRLAKEIDMYLLGHIDPRTNLLIEEAEIEADIQRFMSVGSSLRRFIRSGDTYDLVQLVSAASRHMEGRTSSYLVTELYRSTWQLLFQQIEIDTAQPAHAPRRRSSGDRGFLRRLILWSAIMLGWDERLNWYETETERGLMRGPDTTIVVVENMCRDFLARSSRDAIGEDCLADLWSACNRGLRTAVEDDGHGLAYHRPKMVGLLAAAISASDDKGWFSELGKASSASHAAWQQRQDAKEKDEQKSTVKSLPKPKPPWCAKRLDPSAFDEILARILPGELLRQRVQHVVRPNAMLFHGTAGVGKGTAARLAAQALLCEQTAINGAPCGQCERCREVQGGGGFYFGNGRVREYGDPKVTKRKAKELIEHLVEKANGPSLTDGRVIILENIAPAGDELDGFLKTLEGSPILFILTARDLAEVRPAIRSRCELYEIKPVDAEGTKTWFRQLFASKADVDEQALDVFVALSRGAPGEILRIAETMADCETITLKDVRSKFGLDWPQRLAEDWEIILDTSDGGWQDVGVLAGLPVREKARRIRAALILALGVNDDGRQDDLRVDPALIHLDEATTKRLGKGLRRAAVRHCMTEREYARKVSDFWASYEPLMESYPTEA